MRHRYLCLVVLLAACSARAANSPDGFHDVPWGAASAQVRAAAGGAGWSALADDNAFPPLLKVTRYTNRETVAGYPADVTYYFRDDRFFQATVRFDFPELVNFDFNYNVFISVDKYYTAIHDRTLTFVNDVYALLRSKYGTREPVFKGLDPRFIFKATDAYLQQERWNLRYNPSEYYKRIVTAGYARWDFPRTRVIFSVNISAADKRFDYQLSLTSLDLEKQIRDALDSLRTRDL